MKYGIQFIGFNQTGGKRYRTDPKKQQEFYAKMASVSYGEDKKERLDKMKKFGLDDWKYDSKLSTNDAAVLYNPKTKESVVSIAGTRLKSNKNWLRDLRSDLGISLGTAKFGYRVSENESLAKKVKAKYGDDVTLAAHSLGGRVSKIISRDTGIPAVIFNAGSSPLSVVSDRIANLFRKDISDVTHHTVEGDPISISERLAGDIQKTHTIKPTDTTKSSHSLSQLGGQKSNPWLVHTEKVRKKNMDVKYKDILKLASKSYKKSNPWLVHVKKVRGENMDMKYKDILKLASKSYKK
jgi:hypothetical protein